MKSNRATRPWTVMTALFLANLLNIYDRSIPGIVNEPVRIQFKLHDFQLGLISTAFTLVYAIVGVPLGRLADLRSRKVIMSIGLLVWSFFTGLSGLAWSFGSYLVLRMAVGIGEASCGPAAISMIGDLFPSARRARAMGVFWLGFPAGIILAFSTAGSIIREFGTWRATFFVAMIPGLVLSLCMLLIKEPARGGAEGVRAATLPIDRPIRRVLRIRTIWWISIAAAAINFSGYTANGFLIPLLQRYYGMPIGQAAARGGLILGVTGLVSLLLGGWVVDKIHARFRLGRLLYGASSLALAAVATSLALSIGKGSVTAFTAIFALGWFLQYQYLICIFPALQDVAEPRLRAVATALFYAFIYLLGAAFGPALTGALSDRFARAAMRAAGASQMNIAFRASGLHDAMYLVPAMLLFAGLALIVASATFQADVTAMKRSMTDLPRKE